MLQIQDDEFSKLEFDGWQRVANQYMDIWSGLTRQFIDPLLNAAKVDKGMRVLDVACGPGIVSEKILARKAIPVGIDFSPEMIKIAKHSYPQIDFYEGDAQELFFEDASFDSVVMNFGMLHLPQPMQAMKEAWRVLRKKGLFAFTVWSPSNSPAPKVMNEAKEKFADMDVPMPSAPPYDYFEDRQNCNFFLSKAGFDPETIHFEIKPVRWLVPDAGFLFNAELNAGVRNAAFLRQQTPEKLQKIRQAAEEGVQQFKVKDGYELPFAGCVIAAERNK
jgi:SAM-dependent methyltransferase